MRSPKNEGAIMSQPYEGDSTTVTPAGITGRNTAPAGEEEEILTHSCPRKCALRIWCGFRH